MTQIAKTIDLHHSIRALVPFFCIIFLYDFLNLSGYFRPSISGYEAIDRSCICLALAIVIDLLGLYKLHPTYRKIRAHFFSKLGKKGKKPRVEPRQQKTARAEKIREDLLYALPKQRYANMRNEHAIWISLYHAHILTFVAVCILLFRSFSNTSFNENYLSLLTGAAISAAFLWSAINRNRSYNRKISGLSLGKA